MSNFLKIRSLFFIFVLSLLIIDTSRIFAVYHLEESESNNGPLKISSPSMQISITEEWVKTREHSEDEGERYHGTYLPQLPDSLKALEPQQMEQLVDLLKGVEDKRAYQFLGWYYYSQEPAENAVMSFEYFKKYFEKGGREHRPLYELAKHYVYNNDFKAAKKVLFQKAKFEVESKGCLLDSYLQFLYAIHTIPEEKNAERQEMALRNYWEGCGKGSRLYSFSIKYLREIRKQPLDRIKRRSHQMNKFIQKKVNASALKLDEIDIILYWQKTSPYPSAADHWDWPDRLKNWIKNWEKEIFKQEIEKKIALQSAASSLSPSDKKSEVRVRKVQFIEDPSSS